MKILMVSSRFPPNITGGAEIVAGDVAGALAERGHEVRVLTSRDPQDHNGHQPWVRRTLREVGTGNGGAARQAVAFYRQVHSRDSARQLGDTVATVAPDVVYVWDLSGLGMVSVLRALNRVTVPVVFHLQNYWWHYLNSPETPFSTVRTRWLKRLLIGPVPTVRCTTLIAPSGAVKRAYVRAGCDAELIEVIDNAIDGRFFVAPKTPARPRGQLNLMFAGRLCPEKGVDVALRAIEVLRNETSCDLMFHVYGRGDAKHEAQIRAQAATLDGRVTFHGHVDQDALLLAYDSADIVIIPSTWEEPFGLIAAEAMARSVAVIASATGGLGGVIRDGVDGVLVPAGDAHALADALARLARAPDERRKLGEAATLTARNRFTLEACADRVERHLYRAATLLPHEMRWTG
jgi:glycosyltransferase involved in cell wall biosynthesis